VPQPLDRLPDGLVGQLPGRQPLLEGHVGQQVQRPGAPGLAEAPRGLVEDALERIGLGLVEDRLRILGAALLLVQTADPFCREGVEGVADGADGTSESVCDLGWPLAVGAGPKDLGTPEGECLPATQAGLEYLPLRIGELANE
jgi:hypothetical protein